MNTIQYKLIIKLTKPKTTSQKPREVKVENDYCQAQQTMAPTRKGTGQENLRSLCSTFSYSCKHQYDLSDLSLPHFFHLKKLASSSQQNEIPNPKSCKPFQERNKLSKLSNEKVYFSQWRLSKNLPQSNCFPEIYFRGIFIGVRSLRISYLEIPIVPEIKVIKFRFQLLNIRCPYTSYSPYMRETRYAHTSSCKYPICSGFIYLFIYFIVVRFVIL